MNHEMSGKTFIIIILLGVLGGGIYFTYDYLSTNATYSNDGRIIYAEPGHDIKLSIDSGDAGLGGDWYSNDLAIIIEPKSPRVVVEVNQSEDPSWGPYYNNSTTVSAIDVKGTLHVSNEYTTLPVIYRGTLSGHIETANRIGSEWDIGTNSINVPIELHVVSHEEYQNYEKGLKQQKLSISKFFSDVGWGLLVGVIIAVMSAMPAQR